MARKRLKYKDFADLKDGHAISFDKDNRGNISCQNVSVCTFNNPIGKVAYGIWPSNLNTTRQYYQNNIKNNKRVKKAVSEHRDFVTSFENLKHLSLNQLVVERMLCKDELKLLDESNLYYTDNKQYLYCSKYINEKLSCINKLIANFNSCKNGGKNDKTICR